MTKNGFLSVFTFTSLITILFYKQFFGLNLFLLEISLILFYLLSGKIDFSNKNHRWLVLGFFISGVSTVLTFSAFSIIINFLLLMVFVGTIMYPNARSLLSAWFLSIFSLFLSQEAFFDNLVKSKLKRSRVLRYIWGVRIFVLPLFVILVFIGIYSSSNPIFDDVVNHVSLAFVDVLDLMVFDIEIALVLTVFFAFLLANYFVWQKANPKIITNDQAALDDLERAEPKSLDDSIITFMSLVNELKAGVFLLLVLNALLFLLNVLDIYWVWFNFEWEGQYLKSFVHEGTYLLIVSILISIVLVLYFFRDEMNFYRKNKWLKYLSYFWIAQNVLLAISVAVRNSWYINYFALAYKRIGVFIFLALTLYGLYTVWLKVRDKKSNFFLLRKNFQAFLILLCLSSIVNWDNIIARYNFSQANDSFLHLDFLATLPYKTLPYLDKPLSELKAIEEIQADKFPFDYKYMTAEEYYEAIQLRKEKFKKKWEAKSWQSWNLPEYLAYRELFD